MSSLEQVLDAITSNINSNEDPISSDDFQQVSLRLSWKREYLEILNSNSRDEPPRIQQIVLLIGDADKDSLVTDFINELKKIAVINFRLCISLIDVDTSNDLFSTQSCVTLEHKVMDLQHKKINDMFQVKCIHEGYAVEIYFYNQESGCNMLFTSGYMNPEASRELFFEICCLDALMQNIGFIGVISGDDGMKVKRCIAMTKKTVQRRLKTFKDGGKSVENIGTMTFPVEEENKKSRKPKSDFVDLTDSDEEEKTEEKRSASVSSSLFFETCCSDMLEGLVIPSSQDNIDCDMPIENPPKRLKLCDGSGLTPKTPATPVLNVERLVEGMPTPQRQDTLAVLLENQKIRPPYSNCRYDFYRQRVPDSREEMPLKVAAATKPETQCLLTFNAEDTFRDLRNWEKIHKSKGFAKRPRQLQKQNQAEEAYEERDAAAAFLESGEVDWDVSPELKNNRQSTKDNRDTQGTLSTTPPEPAPEPSATTAPSFGATALSAPSAPNNRECLFEDNFNSTLSITPPEPAPEPSATTAPSFGASAAAPSFGQPAVTSPPSFASPEGPSTPAPDDRQSTNDNRDTQDTLSITPPEPAPEPSATTAPSFGASAAAHSFGGSSSSGQPAVTSPPSFASPEGPSTPAPDDNRQRWKCQFCTRSYVNKYLKDAHQSECDSNPNKVALVRCILCPKVTWLKPTAVKYHNKKHHG